jgi:Flp pilus assembly pilin Flp
MPYRIIGALHARLLTARDQTGQGTVEYVALILLIAAVLGAAVMSLNGKDGGIGTIIVKKLKAALDTVGTKGNG